MFFKDGKIGLFSAICACVGLIVATNVLMTLSQGIGYAGMGFIIAMAIACAINILVALSFAELNSLIPGTGSISHYTLAARSCGEYNSSRRRLPDMPDICRYC